MIKTIYCEEWSLYRKEPHNVLSEDEAKRKSNNGESYVAVLYEDDDLKYVVGVNKMSLTVRFYNENLEDYLLYGFVKKQDKLFLNMANHWNYSNGEIIETILFNFKETGEMIVAKTNRLTNEVEEMESVVDVSSNWEEVVEFGQYQNVIRIER